MPEDHRPESDSMPSAPASDAEQPVDPIRDCPDPVGDDQAPADPEPVADAAAPTVTEPVESGAIEPETSGTNATMDESDPAPAASEPAPVHSDAGSPAATESGAPEPETSDPSTAELDPPELDTSSPGITVKPEVSEPESDATKPPRAESIADRRRNARRRSAKGKRPVAEPSLPPTKLGPIGKVKQRIQPVLPILKWIWKKLIRPVWRQLVLPLWGKFLDVVRSVLPGPFKHLPNRLLTIILLSVGVALWWLVNSLLPHPAPTTARDLPTVPEVVETRPAAPLVSEPPAVEDMPVLEPDETVLEPDEAEVDNTAIDLEPSTNDTPAALDDLETEESVDETEVAAPEQNESRPILVEETPDTEEPDQAIVSEPEPIPPPIVLTADQKKVLDIQAQIDALVDEYSSRLIPAARAEISADRLVLEVSDDWYNLDADQQDQIGLNILARSQMLKFQALELRDHRDILVARNPVVGPNIIVLHRTLSSLPSPVS